MKKVVIIGAGPAGLTAAYELLQKEPGIDLTIIEQDKQVGGLAKTVEYKGNRIDIGGHRFFSKSDKVMDWWMNFFRIDDFPDNGELKYQGEKRSIKAQQAGNTGVDNNAVMLIRKRSSRILFKKKLFEYPIKLSFSTFRKFGFSLTIRVLLSYLKQRINFFPKKIVTLEDFLIRRFGRSLYYRFFKTYTEKVWGKPCSEISYEWGAQRIRGVSLRKIAKNYFKQIIKRKPDIRQKDKETSLVEYFMYPRLGPGHMWEQVALQVTERGCKIQMNERIKHISSENGKVNFVETIHTGTGNTQRYEANTLFSSMAVKDLVACINKKAPDPIMGVAAGLEYRSFITVGILVNRLQMNEIAKDTWLYIQEPDVKIGRLQIFNNWSPWLVADESKFWLGAEYFCSSGEAFWQMDEGAIRQLAIAELEQIGIIRAADVEDSVVVKEPMAYPGYFGSYSRFAEVKSYLDSIPNLYPIGRNGMHKYNNQDHSMLTAMEAVDLFLSGQTNKSSLWDINTEEEYHEQK
ncbi:MAG TPA: NAD(P)/FAD-dependent oxidoreductase [Chitinophagaceae bacterium]|nr:NAD(P)/FAD-dependent oxidoreductase [Chitinophagaceae bacterium]